ncbi:MAG: hypothetical protein U1F43_12355 [Myxococcota bacterium]
MRARVVTAVLVALAASALPLLHGLGFMSGFNTRPSPELAARTTALPPAPAAATPAPGRVAVVIVDGLRADKLPLLGLDLPARCALETVLPSYSRPAYVALSTGVPPTLSGVHTNDHEGPARLESIWDMARRAGRPTHLVTDGIDWWLELFPDAFARADVVGKARFAAWFAAAPPPVPGELLLLHIVAVDDDGHDFGGISPEYERSAIAAGAAIRQLIARLDLSRDVILVTADHGHIDRGGHGGPEDAVMHIGLLAGGHGIAPNPDCHGRLLDLPATVAALLGLPPPAASIGAPLPLLDHPTLVPSAFAPLVPPPLRPLSWLGLALGLALFVAAFAAALAAARGPDLGLLRRVSAGLAWPVVAVLTYLLLEPTLSLSAVWDEDPWTLHMAVAFALPALVVAAVVFFRLVPDPARALPLWALGGLGPLAVAWGLHGALAAGPELGEPHAAFGFIVADLIAAVGGAVGLLVALGRALVLYRTRSAR